MSNTTKRRNFLSELLDKMKPDNTEEVLGQLQTYLDKRGVERKEFNNAKQKGLIEETQAAIAELLIPLTDDEALRNDVANQAMALTMGALANVQPITEEPEETEVMADDEEEPLPEVMMELAEQVKAMAEDNTQIVKDFDELMKVVSVMVDGYKAVVPLVRNVDEYASLTERVKELEKKMRQTPRIASRDKATEVNNPDVLHALKTGTEGKKTVLGLPVKE